MLVPMHCPECGLSFCVKHRLEVDHQCQGKPSKKSSIIPAKSQSKKDPQPSRADMERYTIRYGLYVDKRLITLLGNS